METIRKTGYKFIRVAFFSQPLSRSSNPRAASVSSRIMFLPPKNEAAVAETNAAEQARREAYSRIEAWVIDAIPANYRRGAIVSVQEVVCGDPSCSPIDTAIAILFEG